MEEGQASDEPFVPEEKRSPAFSLHSDSHENIDETVGKESWSTYF